MKKEIIGTKSHKLFVLEFFEKNKTGTRYKCLCDCGNEKIATYNQIKSGRLKSCGCNKIKLNKEQLEQDLKLLSKKEIADKYGFKSVSSLNARIKKLGLFAPKNNTLKHDYFKAWSHNMAYILGFITADGCIHGKRPYLNIELAEKDEYLLHLIKKEFNHSGEVFKYTRYHKNLKKTLTSCKISIYSEVIIEDLRKFGLVSNKTKKGLFINVDLIPEEFFYDFFRGWFDGDGSPDKKKGYMKITCNDIDFIKKIQSRIDLQSSIQKKETYYNLIYCKGSSRKIYNKIYYGDCLCLDRKRQILKEILEKEDIRKYPKVKKKKDKFLGVRKSSDNLYYSFIGDSRIAGFDTEEKAAKARDILVLNKFGKDCVLNFPEMINDYISGKIVINCKKQNFISSIKYIQKNGKYFTVYTNNETFGYNRKQFKFLEKAEEFVINMHREIGLDDYKRESTSLEFVKYEEKNDK